ncbi:MAG: vanadium-dependent haloperoxidase [Proteobacteria bacterium]|nr:vanadium-dependent haloperoxidase [Pseudomonadota bacterium]
MLRFWLSAALLCASALVSANPLPNPDSAMESSDEVVQWNKTLLSIVRMKGAQPATLHPTRSFAMLHVAIYDAVNSIEPTHKPYLVHIERVSPHASRRAAIASAAHEILVTLYPTFQTTLDQQFEMTLADIADGPEKSAGTAVGRAVGLATLAARKDDGSGEMPIPYVFGTHPGDYQSTPTNFPKQPQFTHWSRVTPFVLERARQFRPAPPPLLTSPEYTAAFKQVKEVGIASTANPPSETTTIGLFWNGAIQNYWNEITQTEVKARHLTTAQTARAFALLNVTLADEVIAFYDAKYTYNFWRPVTAIRAADKDGNPQTVKDANWLPQSMNTAPDPSYPGAHAAISAGGAFVLTKLFGHHRLHLKVTSETLPGVIRSFDSFAAVRDEASVSRVFAGQHFSTDEAAGEVLGKAVAEFAVRNVMTRAKRGDRDDDNDRDDDSSGDDE